MTTYMRTNGALGLSALITQVHRIATGHDVPLRQAGRYFRDPKELARLVRQSGAMRSNRKRTALAELLSAFEREARNGI